MNFLCFFKLIHFIHVSCFGFMINKSSIYIRGIPSNKKIKKNNKKIIYNLLSRTY